jgi:DHA2 family multidrug resistance protein
VPKEQNNDVSGLTNLARNMGGSVGTALVATLLARQAQRHQTYLGAHVVSGDGPLLNTMAALQHRLLGGGMAPAQVVMGSMAQLYHQIDVQANLLAYVDIIQLFAVASLCMVPLVFLMKKTKGGGAMH